MVSQDSIKQKCPRCTNDKLIEVAETSETCCSNCGYVINDESIDTRQEWKSFTDSSTGDRARAGSPTSLAVHDQGLSTNISNTYKDATGKSLTSDMQHIMKRLRVWDARSKSNTIDKNLMAAFGELARMADKLVLSNTTIEKAAYIYRKAVEAKLVRGRSINALVAASVYAACRLLSTPRNLKDIEEAANIKRKDIARCYRLLLQNLDITVDVVDPIQCIARIGSNIGLSEKAKREAVKILNEARKNDIVSGKDPMGLAAAALYLACVQCGINKTQRNIAMAAGVTEVTIRNRYKGLKDMKVITANTIELIKKKGRK